MSKSTMNTDEETMKRVEVAMTSLRERFPDLFGNVSMDRIVEYSCIGTAASRSVLAKKGDGICNDDLAAKICGEEGAAFVKATGDISYFFGIEPTAYIGLRTYFVDHAMNARHPSIHQIVILGSGIDTRAFRLQGLADCHVIEVDGSKIIQAFKQKRIDELKLPLLAKQRDVLVMDLADPTWPQRLFAMGFQPREPTFWLLEGFLMYLTPAQSELLLSSIDKLSAPHSELFCDTCAGSAIFKDVTPWAERIRRNDKDNEILETLPWTNEVVLRRSKELKYSGSLWDPVRFQNYVVTRKEDDMFGPFSFSWLKKEAEEKP